ncbi:phospholipase [Amylocarpus encephaloides]|uniref:Phospholipase n=1 Tax=Amylocarpus encephaloides TaxID=45428 RepID=A0A9P7Y7I3_9HELO|nr:phospholipase [Amylocarpus encephaloides]
MPFPTRPESLRVLCLDGGGIKGYTSLLILRRIFLPKPCDIFDLIAGTSTGGLIAVMLGRLNMSIDECITTYEDVGGQGLRSSSFYDIEIMQDEIKKIMDRKKIPRHTSFREGRSPTCKLMLCVTRAEISKPDVIRNFESFHPTAENYNCTIWEAASATAAAPMYFKGVQFCDTGEKWYDGGLRRNPINEAFSELSRERDWKDRKVGCVLSLGCGVAKSAAVSSNLAGILKGAVAIMTDADDIARVFASSGLGIELFRTHRYFWFNPDENCKTLP